MGYALLAVCTGMMVSAQSSLNGMLYPFFGVFGVGFAAQFLNALTSLVLRICKTRKLPQLKGMPFHCCFGGFCAILVLGFSGFLVTRLGAAVTVSLSVAGQLFISAIVDHFGLFRTPKTRFQAVRLPGFLAMLAGIVVINFSGLDSFTAVDNRWVLALLLLLNLSLGIITLFARLFNYEASRYVGKLDGAFVSAAAGSAAAALVLLLVPPLRPTLEMLPAAPLPALITGPLGAVACMCNMLCYDKMKIFHATIFMLVGQLLTGILADLFYWGSLQPMKLLGILIVIAGIFWDKKKTAVLEA